MQITENFDDICQLICPHCAKGMSLRFRTDSGEWVHDEVTKLSYRVHTICWANGLRKKYQNEKS
jgi:hypothetical protein